MLGNAGLADTYLPTEHPENPVVFLDIGIKGSYVGRIYLELFAHAAPKTAENFRQYCTGEHVVNLVPQGFKGSPFHRVIKDFMVQGGDIVNGDGTGRISIYGSKFDDEAGGLALRHNAAGLLSMANSGPDTNGCQFFVTCAPCPWLDGKHVVFGKVLRDESMLVLRKIENTPTVAGTDKPRLAVTVMTCGQM